MQNPRTGVRWMVAAITSMNITAFAPGHAASVAPVTAENGMVVSAQHLATMVGVDVLKRGGNAVDAAVSVGYALAVVYPAAGNLGGGRIHDHPACRWPQDVPGFPRDGAQGRHRQHVPRQGR